MRQVAALSIFARRIANALREEQQGNGKHCTGRGEGGVFLGVEDVVLEAEETVGPVGGEGGGYEPFDQLVSGARGEDEFDREGRGDGRREPEITTLEFLDRDGQEQSIREMDEAIVVVAAEAESFGDVPAEPALRPGIVGNVRVEISRAERVQGEEEDDRGEAEPADGKAVREPGEKDDGEDGGDVLQQEVLEIGRIDATGGKENEEN